MEEKVTKIRTYGFLGAIAALLSGVSVEYVFKTRRVRVSCN